jgi:hypothetical protein
VRPNDRRRHVRTGRPQGAKISNTQTVKHGLKTAAMFENRRTYAALMKAAREAPQGSKNASKNGQPEAAFRLEIRANGRARLFRPGVELLPDLGAVALQCPRRRIIETGVARAGGRGLRRHEGGVAQKSEDHLSAGGADDLVVGGIKIRPGRRELRAIDSSSQWFGQTQI